MAIKEGKLSERVLKRAVLKQFQVRRPEVLVGAKAGFDCAALRVEADEAVVLTSDPVIGTLEELGELAVVSVLNDLACSGAQAVGILVNAIFPLDITEPEIRKIIKQMEIRCQAYQVQVLGGHTQVSRAVHQPVLSMTGVGKVKATELISAGDAKPGDDIILTKWIGLAGTWMLAAEYEEELRTRYPIGFIKEAQELKECICAVPEAMVAKQVGVHAMHDVTEGGVFGSLWELAEASGVGLDIDVRKIPVRQETIEVCEFFGLNPYELVSCGSMLMATADGNQLVAELEKAGIYAAIIGKATDSNDRVLHNGEEIRFLEPAKQDAMYQLADTHK